MDELARRIQDRLDSNDKAVRQEAVRIFQSAPSVTKHMDKEYLWKLDYEYTNFLENKAMQRR